MNRLAFNWGVSSFYGWGVYGMNLALQMAAQRPDIELTCGSLFGPGDVVLDPLRDRVLAALAERSKPLLHTMDYHRDVTHRLEHPVLVPLMNDIVAGSSAHGWRLDGSPSIGVCFLEQATLTDEGRSRAADLALIVAGSSWNERILRDQGVKNVVTVLQGVDTSIFHPAPKAGLFPGRFVVFSGGKLEFRKGQDIVLAAFRAFHQRHPEALLLAAWSSPWGHLAAAAVGREDIEPCNPMADGKTPDVMRWAVDNGIPADAIVSIGATPNIAMPHVMREADVALFCNRSEGGTNLPAMECMACGVPALISRNTGHLDLEAAIGLFHQSRVERRGVETADWGESSVEEAVETLEFVRRSYPRYTTERGVEAMAEIGWHHQIGRLLQEIERVTG